MKQIGLFDEEKRLDKLSELGDSLEKLNGVINWERFRPILDRGMEKMRKERKGPGGRPAYEFVLLFKILVLARLFNLSDDQAEYQINDRMSFMGFLGLGLEDSVPDAKTIWLFRDTMPKANVIEELFAEFTRPLRQFRSWGFFVAVLGKYTIACVDDPLLLLQGKAIKLFVHGRPALT